MKIRWNIAEAIATAGYIGYFPFAPGTLGAGIGCLIYMAAPLHSAVTELAALTGFIAFSVWIAGKAEQSFKMKDPGCIVIDEIAGSLVTFFALPPSIFIGIAGFVLFRIFDILKPFPIRWLEKKLPGGFGVVMDDVAAGIISNIILHLIIMVKQI